MEEINQPSAHIRILSVDDHPLLREGIAAIINQADMLLTAVASSGREGIQSFREHKPDVALMDLRLPDLSGIDASSRSGQNFRRRASSCRPPAQEHSSRGVARSDSQGPFREEDRSARSRRATRGAHGG